MTVIVTLCISALLPTYPSTLHYYYSTSLTTQETLSEGGREWTGRRRRKHILPKLVFFPSTLPTILPATGRVVSKKPPTQPLFFMAESSRSKTNRVSGMQPARTGGILLEVHATVNFIDSIIWVMIVSLI